MALNTFNILQQSLGGPGPANSAAASTLAPGLSDAMTLQGQFQNFLAGAAPAPTPQQELPEINIDALRKISDPRIMQMAFNMLMQRDAMKARGQEFGVMPGYWGQLNPAERRTDALRIAGGGSASQTDLMKDLKEAQDVINAGTEIIDAERVVKPGHEEAVAEAQRRVLDLTETRRNANIASRRKEAQQFALKGNEAAQSKKDYLELMARPEPPEGRVEPTKKTEPKVRVISPNGVRGSIPASRLQEALKNGYKRA